MASVMVGDHATTQVVPLAISTTCAARASIKAGVNARSQRLLSVTASEEEAATFWGCYYWKKKYRLFMKIKQEVFPTENQ